MYLCIFISQPHNRHFSVLLYGVYFIRPYYIAYILSVATGACTYYHTILHYLGAIKEKGKRRLLSSFSPPLCATATYQFYFNVY